MKTVEKQTSKSINHPFSIPPSSPAKLSRYPSITTLIPTNNQMKKTEKLVPEKRTESDSQTIDSHISANCNNKLNKSNTGCMIFKSIPGIQLLYFTKMVICIFLIISFHTSHT